LQSISALNRIFFSANQIETLNYSIRFHDWIKLTNQIAGKKRHNVIFWKNVLEKFWKFFNLLYGYNGYNKVVIEIRVVQLWSEIKLTITNPITDQIALHSVFIY
jgi:hypothetical protein